MNRRTAALLLAAAPFAAAAPIRADDATVSVGVTPAADAVPLFYAMSAGLFDRAGLKIDRQQLANGAAIAAAVAGNVVDVGFSNVQTIVLAHVKGIPFVMLAAGGEYNDATPTTQLVVRSDATIKTAKDLEGKTVAVGALKDLQSLSTMAWMASNGADPTKVSFIETPASAAPALLAQKRADAINVSEPNLYNAISSGNARVLASAYSAIAKRLPVSAYFSNRSFPATRPDVAKKFIDVMHRASDYANGHAEEMNALIADYAKIPAATLRAMNHAHQGTVVDTVGLQKIIDASATFHMIDKPFAAAELVYG
jgi:NitT/TauT family transport system substrate-binding protein